MLAYVKQGMRKGQTMELLHFGGLYRDFLNDLFLQPANQM